MSHQPLLSVIVPVYNVAAYLRECLDSLLHQTYHNLEIILVDDGSTDDSPLICAEYARKDERIHLITKVNGGLSSARNAGIEVARGEYVSFLDSDDWLEPDACAILMRAFVEDGSIDIVRAEFRECYPDRVENNIFVSEQTKTFVGVELIEALSEGIGLNAIVCTSAYRLSMLRELGLHFLDGLYHEDEYFTPVLYGILPNIRLRYIPEVIYNYRKEREGSITSKPSLKRLQDLVEGYQFVYKQYEGLGDVERQGLINIYILNNVEAIMQKMLPYFSLSELHRTVKPLCQIARNYPLPKRSEMWLFRLFIFNPRLSFYFGKVYQPLARRLGISKRYR